MTNRVIWRFYAAKGRAFLQLQQMTEIDAV